MAGITLNVFGNFRDFIRGTQDTSRALDKVADSLDDVAKDGAKDVERLERSFRDLTDTAKRETKDAGDSIKKNVGGGLRDLKDEAGQSGREAAASFTGSFDDVGDFAQETLANGLAGFGPIGAAAGIAAAAGLGALWSSIQENAEASEQRISDMYDDMLESGQSFLSESFIRDAVSELGRDAGKFNEALKLSEQTGVSVQTVLRAMVGDQEAINSVVDATNEKRDAELEKINANADGSAEQVRQQDAINLKADETIAKLQGINDEQATAAARAAAVAAAFGTGNAVLDEGVRKIQDMASKLDGIGDKTIRLTADDSDIQRKLGLLQGRTITVNVNGQITRIGNQVW